MSHRGLGLRLHINPTLVAEVAEEVVEEAIEVTDLCASDVGFLVTFGPIVRHPNVKIVGIMATLQINVEGKVQI
jgi:hypothetical protein